MADERDWARLGDYIRARREKLKLSREDLAMRTGVSYRTIGEAERRRPVNENTLTAIDGGLGWPPGASRRILAGGEPETPPQPRRYDDPTLDYLSRTPGLPDELISGLIGMVRGFRGSGGGHGRVPG